MGGTPAGAPALAQLPAVSPWAARHLDTLAGLERHGLAAARGSALVHFDALPHNILRNPSRVLFADWPHARLGAPFIDLLMVLASAGGTGIDLDQLLARQAVAAGTDPADLDGVLAALTGFWLADGLAGPPPGLSLIAAAKLELGRGALGWLARRLGAPAPASAPAASTALTSTESWRRSC